MVLHHNFLSFIVGYKKHFCVYTHCPMTTRIAVIFCKVKVIPQSDCPRFWKRYFLVYRTSVLYTKNYILLFVPNITKKIQFK